MRVSGYDPVIVFDWLETHCTHREDGRYVRMGTKVLRDSHRDTFQRWRLFAENDPTFRVPLDRWSDILFIYGVELYEFEAWAEDVYGTDGFALGDAASEDTDYPAA